MALQDASGGAMEERRMIGELGWRMIRFHYGNSIYLLRDLKLLGKGGGVKDENF